MIPLYILGLLQRFGPQHGYQIKKTIAEQLSDFTQIKLPTIYYHLEKMESDGLVLATSEKPNSRPEKTVYSVTAKGLEVFQTKLNGLLDFDYQPVFPADGAFYFSEHLEYKEISRHLQDYIQKLNRAIDEMQQHKIETMAYIPDEMQTMAKVIFSHHEHHYHAELDWAVETLTNLNKQEEISC